MAAEEGWEAAAAQLEELSINGGAAGADGGPEDEGCARSLGTGPAGFRRGGGLCPVEQRRLIYRPGPPARREPPAQPAAVVPAAAEAGPPCHVDHALRDALAHPRNRASGMSPPPCDCERAGGGWTVSLAAPRLQLVFSSGARTHAPCSATAGGGGGGVCAEV